VIAAPATPAAPRRLLSARYPWVYRARVAELRVERDLADLRHRTRFARRQSAERLPVVITGHGSLLRRRLGATDPALQEAKITNLRLAIRAVDGLVIEPGEVFSFWERVGPPSARRGFVDGLVLRGGRPATGTGGGLCQLANLLHWLALHTPLEVAERHHHGVDPFPDDRRALPFGTGASVFYNYVDLRLRNPTKQPFQLEAWLTERELRGRIRASHAPPVTYHVFEVGHHFEAAPEGVVRCNEVWRRTVDRATGRTLVEERLMRNRLVVGYAVDAALVEAPGGGPWASDGSPSPGAGAHGLLRAPVRGSLS
jgi:vancomycin resistance protein VanW